MGRSRFNVPKLVWPVAITSAILLLLGIGGAWYVLQLQTAASDILAWNVTSIRAAEELEISVRELRNRLNRFLLSDDASQLTDVPQLQVLCQQWLAESARLGRSDREREFIRNIEIGMARLSDHLKRLHPELTHEETRKLVRELTDQGLWDQILKHSNEYLDFNERELATSSQHNQVLAERLALSLVMIGICGAAGGVLAGYGLARGIMRTIVQISLPIHDVAGQLDEVVGPISVSNMRHRDDLDQTLRTVSAQVTAVIERLHQREREALRAEQLAALGQLSAGLAHELRNPLMSMKILVQSAQSDDRGLLDGTDLDVLDDEIGRLETLVSTFLDFARPPDPAKRRINLGDHEIFFRLVLFVIY